MPSLEEERAALLGADAHIAVGEQRIEEQRILLARLRRYGQDTDSAARLLRLTEETQEIWQAHRQQILASIARLEDGPNPYDWDDLA
jgi:NTP pyrophosphatase (non-canonical NTP hydrolase)